MLGRLGTVKFGLGYVRIPAVSSLRSAGGQRLDDGSGENVAERLHRFEVGKVVRSQESVSVYRQAVERQREVWQHAR